MIVDLAEFLVSGQFGPLGSGAKLLDIRRAFGEPDVLTPSRKSYPTMLVYGDVEFCLRNDRLTVITISLTAELPSTPATMKLRGLLAPSERRLDLVAQLLKERGVSWRLDAIMSEESSPVYITARGVHMAFNDNTLVRAAADYGSYASGVARGH